MKTFERGALGVAGTLVVGLVAAFAYFPPVLVTSAPKAVLPASATLPPPLVKVSLSETGGLQELASGTTAHKLSRTFSSLGYEFESVLSGTSRVPRFFLATLPADMAKVREVKVRKAIFFQTVLPLVLQVNEEILAERRRLWDLRTRPRVRHRRTLYPRRPGLRGHVRQRWPPVW